MEREDIFGCNIEYDAALAGLIALCGDLRSGKMPHTLSLQRQFIVGTGMGGIRRGDRDSFERNLPMKD